MNLIVTYNFLFFLINFIYNILTICTELGYCSYLKLKKSRSSFNKSVVNQCERSTNKPNRHKPKPFQEGITGMVCSGIDTSGHNKRYYDCYPTNHNIS